MFAGGGGEGPGAECEADNYLQFGRDILFVTTHLSNKLCYNKTVINNRQYVEIEVRFQMDYLSVMGTILLVKKIQTPLMSDSITYLHSLKYPWNNILSAESPLLKNNNRKSGVRS